MSKFDPHIRHILSRIYSNDIADNIANDLNEILPLIINGDLSMFKSNEKNNTSLSSLNLFETEFYKKLTTTVDKSGVLNKEGFNKLTIMSTFMDQDVGQFLNDIPNEYLQDSIQLDSILKGFDSNLTYFKVINQCIQGYESIITDISSDPDVPYRFFNYIYNVSYDETDSGKIPFVYLYGLIILYLGYSKLTRYQSDVYYYLKDNDRLNPVDIGNAFSSYYDTNAADIVNTIEKYCYKNICLFSENYTMLFDWHVDVAIDASIRNLVILFEDRVDILTNGNDFLTKVLANSVDQISYKSALYWMDRVENDYVSEGTFYEYLSELFDVDVFGTVALEEDAIYQEVREYVLTNITDLESVEYVSWQFNAYPLFFINSHIYLHSQYSSNLIDGMQTTFSIADWDAKIIYESDRNDKFRTYLEHHSLGLHSSAIIKCAMCAFADLTTMFMDSEEVTDWIISDFFPNFKNAINVNYLKDFNVYERVDEIRWIFKLKFIHDIFDRKLFVFYIYELVSIIATHLPTENTVNISDVSMDLLFDNYPKNGMSTILDGTYKSVYVNNYLKELLKKYSI